MMLSETRPSRLLLYRFTFQQILKIADLACINFSGLEIADLACINLACINLACINLAVLI